MTLEKSLSSTVAMLSTDRDAHTFNARFLVVEAAVRSSLDRKRFFWARSSAARQGDSAELSAVLR